MSLLTTNVRTSSTTGTRVRIGAVSVFALVIILCMAVLAVLTISTAHSSLALSQRQAAAVQEHYRNETAAQTFLAELESLSAGARTQAAATENAATSPATSANTPAEASGSSADAASPAVSNADLIAARNAAQAATDGAVEIYASAVGNTVYASFAGPDGRTLDIALTARGDGTYRIDQWSMTAVVNEEQPLGTLYKGA